MNAMLSRSRIRWRRKQTCRNCRRLRTSRRFGWSSSASPSYVVEGSLRLCRGVSVAKCGLRERLFRLDTGVLNDLTPAGVLRADGLGKNVGRIGHDFAALRFEPSL